jgi:hypothetical protein
MRHDEWSPESLGQIVGYHEWPTRLVVVAVDSTNDRGTHSERVPIALMLSRGVVSLLTRRVLASDPAASAATRP